MDSLLASKRKEYGLVILFFTLVSIVFTWPLVLHLHNGVLGGTSDPLLNTWIMTWDAHTFFTHPAQLFQANILYPARDVLAYSEHLFTMGIMAAPIYYLTGNSVLAYNLLIFFAFVFSAFGCYLLVKELTGSRWGALIGGLFFAFCPFKTSKLGLLHVLFSPFLPFMLLYLYRYLYAGKRKNLVLFAFFFLAQSLASWHYLLFCSLAAGLLWLWTAAFSRTRSEWNRLLGVVLVALIIAAAILPLALPYLRVHERMPGFERTLSNTEYFAAYPRDFLTVSEDSVIYGNSLSPLYIEGLKQERVLFPGLTIIILALAGLLIRRKPEDDTQAFDPDSFRGGALYFLVLIVISLILSMGPEIAGVTNLFYTIPYHLGLFKFIRFPGRFYVLAALGLSVLAGYGAGKLCLRATQSGRSRRFVRLAMAAVVLILLAELATFNLHVSTVPVWGEVPEAYAWLKEQGDVRVIELPDISWDFELKGMIVYLSTFHWKDIANGYSGYRPPSYEKIFTEMEGFPSGRSVDVLREVGIDYVFWHWDWVDPQARGEYRSRLSSQEGLRLERTWGEIAVYAVEPGPSADANDLEATLDVAAEAREGEEIPLFLHLRNPSEYALLSFAEDPQDYTLVCRDERDGMVSETAGEIQLYIFLEGGEAAVFPLEAQVRLEPGVRTLELRFTSGILDGRVLYWQVGAD
jgi:hypothetical protein